MKRLLAFMSALAIFASMLSITSYADGDTYYGGELPAAVCTAEEKAIDGGELSAAVCIAEAPKKSLNLPTRVETQKDTLVLRK